MKIVPNRFAVLCMVLGLASFFNPNHLQSQTVTTNAIDNAGNYAGNWGDGSNGGTGFQAWTFKFGAGTGGAGRFIGSPANAGISGMSESSFALYANPAGSGAFIDATRVFSSSLAIGDTIQFKWAINWDSAGGNKGFSLSAGSTEIINVNNGSSQDITINGNNVNFGYGTNAMTWSFTRTTTNSVRVVANDRDGVGSYSNNITVVNGAIDRIKFYSDGLSNENGGNREPYFNDFLITSTTADVTPPVINLAAGVDLVTWVAKDGTVNLSANDVIATDNSGSVDVTFPSSLNTSTDDSLIVLYTATDGSGNSTSVQRVILVGSGGGNWFYSTLPRTLSVSPLTSATAGGELWVDGATSGSGATTGVQAWVGVNSGNTDPATWGEAAWSPALFASQAGNNDRYEAQISGSNLTVGANHYYATRFRLGTNGGNTNYFYGGIATNGMGGRWDGTTYGSGILTVEAGRLVTYTVDMGVYRRKLGTFNPSNHTLRVRTGLNNSGTYSEFALSNSTSDLYSGTFPISGAGGATNFFKFYWAGSGGLEWESDIGDRPLVLSANGVATNAGTNFFNNLEGRRSVSYAVDMSVQKFKGLFNPSNHTLQVRTGLSTPGYAERALTNSTGDLYEGTFAVDGADASTNLFKFYAAGTNGLTWEDGADRQLVLAVTATNQHAGTNFFGDVSESRKITLSVDMSVQVSKGRFDPSTNTVAVASSLDWAKSAVLAPAPGLGVNLYSVDIFADGPLPVSVQYIFSHNGTNNVPNSGYEIGGNRSVVKADINPTNLSSTTLPLALFSRDDGIGPVITRTGPATINLTVGDSYTDAGATAADAIDGSVTVTPSGTVDTSVAGTYTVTYNASDAAGNAATSVTRTVIVAAASGSTFAGWSSNALVTTELVGKYGIGGATSSSAASERPEPSLDSNTLSLSAIVRTNDAKLKVEGEASGSLTNWSTNGVTMTASPNTNGVPEGHQRQVFGVDRTNSPTRQFLRLKATLAP